MYIKIWRKRIAKYIYLCNSALRRYFSHQLAVFKRPLLYQNGEWRLRHTFLQYIQRLCGTYLNTYAIFS